MIGKDKLFTLIEKAMEASRADQTEVVVAGSSSGLTRFANSYIHQNVAVDDVKIYFRVAVGKKLGTASCNSLKLTDLKRAQRIATQIAKRQKENPDFDGFAKPGNYATTDTFDEKTSRFKPRQRASKLKRVFKKGEKYDYSMAGAFSTGDGEIAVLNSNGVRCYQNFSSASINVIASGENSSGYAAGISSRIDDVDIPGFAAIAVKKCRMSRDPKELEPGKYDVILEPAAIAEVFEWLNFVAFGSKAYEDQTSFLYGRIGEQVAGENVTIYDDALETGNEGLPFDFEGVPKKRVDFIKNGKAEGVVHNLISAKKAGMESTGHGLPPELAAEGALPLNIRMAAGNQSSDELIAGVEDGLLVTRFHYLNGLLDPRQALMTGMTRDGLFRIKNGKVKHGLKNLRFTESMMDAFKNVTGISNERTAVASWWGSLGSMYVPTLRIKEFNFSGKTDF